jgi:hypothetical protein
MRIIQELDIHYFSILDNHLHLNITIIRVELSASRS